MRERRRGVSYQKRVHDINEIYDRYAKTGLSNREIWRRYIWPTYMISERTLYNLLKAPERDLGAGVLELTLFD
jgi:hypothetical protein